MMKPTRNAPLKVKVNRELATSRSRLRTIAGIVADSAGTKNTVIAATRKLTMYAAVTLSPRTSSGITATARSVLVTTRTRLRSVRSTTTPANTPKTTAGRIARRMRIEEEVFDFVISPTRTMSAKVVALAATCERICAAHSARKGRLRMIPRSAMSPGCSIGPGRLVDRRQRATLDEPLDVALELAAGDEDAAPAGRAAHADIRSEPHDAPGIAAAGVHLPQHDDVVEVQRQRRLGHQDAQSRSGAQRWAATAGTSIVVSFMTAKRVFGYM